MPHNMNSIIITFRFQMLMANIGRVVYPSYTVNRQRAVFKDRDALIRYVYAFYMELL